MCGERGAELGEVVKAGTGFDADHGDERSAGRGLERLAARQDRDVVGEDVGFGEISDADGGGKDVEVFRLFPRPKDASGNAVRKRGRQSGEG
jgi:hypothetical protein